MSLLALEQVPSFKNSVSMHAKQTFVIRLEWRFLQELLTVLAAPTKLVSFLVGGQAGMQKKMETAVRSEILPYKPYYCNIY